MDYLNFHTSVLDSEEFILATQAQRGVWLCLYRFCAGQENGGRISHSKAWPARVWAQICAVSSRDLATRCGLWSWDGDTLVVKFYNLKNEDKVRRDRSLGAAAAHARWHKNSNAVGNADCNAVGNAVGNADGNADGNAVGNTKGKERKGKERKDIPEHADALPGQGSLPEQPGLNGHRKPKPGSMLPSEQPPMIAERMLAVAALKSRAPTTPWTAKEFEAFKAARLDTSALDDFTSQIEVMRRYYSAKIPRETDYRRRELLTLLNNWPGELDKARMYLRDNNDGYTTAT